MRTYHNYYQIENDLEEGLVNINFTRNDPDSLPDNVRKRLHESNATQLDMMYVRHSLHKITNNLQSYIGNLNLLQQKVEELTYIDVVKNGDLKKTEKVSVTEIIPKLVLETRKSRWRTRLRDVIAENKTITWILGIISSGIVIIFRERLLEVLIEVLTSLKKFLT